MLHLPIPAWANPNWKLCCCCLAGEPGERRNIMMADGLGMGQSFAAAQFGVLGPLQVRTGGESLPLGTPKQRAVLAMLIVNANRPVSIDSLIGAAGGAGHIARLHFQFATADERRRH